MSRIPSAALCQFLLTYHSTPVELSVDQLTHFEWNTEAYKNLVIPAKQKSVLTTLVEAHSSGPASKIDDFVKGKGMGLVINLYGNPGTGEDHSSLSIHKLTIFYV